MYISNAILSIKISINAIDTFCNRIIHLERTAPSNIPERTDASRSTKPTKNHKSSERVVRFQKQDHVVASVNTNHQTAPTIKLINSSNRKSRSYVYDISETESVFSSGIWTRQTDYINVDDFVVCLKYSKLPT